MQTLKEIKKRVGSVKNTQKITNAMKLVSSAKFNKAGKAVVGARPYRQALDGLIGQLLQPDVEHKFLQAKQIDEQGEQKTLILLFTSDRGLCGALNANMLKHLEKTLRAKHGDSFASSVDFIAIGRKAQQFCRKYKLNCILEQSRVEQLDPLVWQRELLKTATEKFQAGYYSKVYLAYQLFVSGLKQVPTWQQFLPIDTKAAAEHTDEQAGEMLLEPDREQVIDRILNQHLANQLFCALLNNSASEHCARMNAMDSATNNAKKVVKELTLQYNRGRQAAITKELIEITAGVQAI